MFRILGQFATRYRKLIIVVWIVLAGVITLIAPDINEVSSSNQADFLPLDAPFIHANQVYKDTFPEAFYPGSSIVVVDAREAGGIPLTESGGVDTTSEIGKFISDFEAWLNSPDKPSNVGGVFAPTTTDLATTLLLSSTKDVAIIRVSLTTTGTELATQQTLHTIDNWLSQHAPSSIKVYQTGEAPIVTNTVESVAISVDRTIWVTIALVVLMLLLVYRSPVSPLVPLLAVTVAYLITRGIVAFIGANVMTITSYTNILLVVVLYGAGTDYCLFLISRFREEMADQIGVEQATRNTVELVSETISSSAGTIFVGFVAMFFSKMGIFSSSGPALAIGIIVAALAGLTFTPALLATLGERAFWPGHAKHRDTGRLYQTISKQVSSHPLAAVIIIVVIMLPLSIYGLNQRFSYNMLGDLPDDADAVRGYHVLEESLGQGNIMPLSLIITARDPRQVAGEIITLSADLAAMPEVDDVRSLNSPLGQNNPLMDNLLRLDTQINLAASMMAAGSVDQSSLSPQQIQPLLTGLQAYFAEIAANFPQIADDPNLTTIQSMLENPLSLLLRRAEFVSALNGLAERFSPTAADPISSPYLMPTSLLTLAASVGGDEVGGMMSQLKSNYLNSDGTAYKLDVVLAGSPNSYETMDTVLTIRDMLKAYDNEQGDAVVSGTIALLADVRATIDEDLLRTIGLVLLGIFFVLLFMLRSVVAPLYLIATVLLSFAFTLGLTNIVFKAVWDVPGLTWYVPFFMFVFLVALGIDYSIFVFGRIKEEVAYHGTREGIHIAVARTGSIITSAGIILAGTFAAMITGEIKGLAEMGFAVAAGVLIDTFVVRTMLVPALATLFGRWTWWPSGLPKPQSQRQNLGEPVLNSGD